MQVESPFDQAGDIQELIDQLVQPQHLVPDRGQPAPQPLV